MIPGIATKNLDALRRHVDQDILLQAVELAIGSKLAAAMESCSRFGEDFGDQQWMADVVRRQAITRIAGDQDLSLIHI